MRDLPSMKLDTRLATPTVRWRIRYPIRRKIGILYLYPINRRTSLKAVGCAGLAAAAGQRSGTVLLELDAVVVQSTGRRAVDPTAGHDKNRLTPFCGRAYDSLAKVPAERLFWFSAATAM
jgi:hypothetical protein